MININKWEHVLNAKWIFVILLLLYSGSASSQQLFKYLDHPVLNEKQQHHARVLIEEETTQGYWYVETNNTIITNQSGSFEITLPTEEILQISDLSYSNGFASTFSGSGKFHNGSGDLIFTEHNGMITARAGNERFNYMLYPLSGNVHILLLLNTTVFPHDESAEGYEDMIEKGKEQKGNTSQAPRIDPETGSPVSPSQLLLGDCKVRVLVAYTDDVGVALADPIGFAQSCIQANNTAFSNSAVNFQVELACAYQTTYAESNNSATDKTVFRNIADGVMDEVANWRTYYDADLCHLLVNSLSNGCGEAWSVSVSAYADAFCVTDRTCAVGNLTFPHELGHLYGARHDVYVDGTNTPYAYGHGKTVPGSYRTVMAYSDACTAVGQPCTRVAYFSNPAISYLGTSTGTSGSADNESAHEASRVAISGLEAPIAAKIFPAWTHNADEYADVIAITSITNNAGYVMNSGSNVTWRAGTTHTMLPGFWAKSGSKFITAFDNCTPLAAANNEVSRMDATIDNNSFVKVQPNPFNDQFKTTVYLKQDGFLRIELLDATGKSMQVIVDQNDAFEGRYEFTVDMQGKAQGIYFLVVSTGEEVKTSRLMKIN